MEGAGKIYFSMDLLAWDIAANHIRRKFHINESPAASSQVTSKSNILADVQMTAWVSKNVKSHKINKAMPAPGGISVPRERFLRFMVLYDLMHSLPGDVEFIRDFSN